MNENDVWLGTASGGLWHSSDINSFTYTWNSSPPELDAEPIGAILLEDCTAQRCDTVWVGTGENNIRRDTYYGAGLFVLRWNANDGNYATERVADTGERFRNGNIVDIARLSGDLYIGVSKGRSASRSTTIVTAPEPQDGYGIHRSSDEGQS
ncbi:MAG: hypothetical protein ACE5EU_11030 [Paracoccaceae bacterium]